MNISQETVFEIASEVRKEFETGSVPRELLAELYHDYNPRIKDIHGFLDQAASLFPVQNCGVASVYLKHIFSSGEIEPGGYIFPTTVHTILDLGKIGIADITADQFGGSPVYVGPLQYPYLKAEI